MANRVLVRLNYNTTGGQDGPQNFRPFRNRDLAGTVSQRTGAANQRAHYSYPSHTFCGELASSSTASSTGTGDGKGVCNSSAWQPGENQSHAGSRAGIGECHVGLGWR